MGLSQFFCGGLCREWGDELGMQGGGDRLSIEHYRSGATWYLGGAMAQPNFWKI